MKRYIKDLAPGDLFTMSADPNTGYRATRVLTMNNMTRVAYTIEGSHWRQETEFARPSLTICTFIPEKG